MQIDYIRRNTPESFSEEGGAYIQIVNKQTTGLSASIEEARAALHVVGSAELIEGYFVGIMKSVFEGIRDDGHPRTVGDISFYPVCGGKFDLDKGWDPAVNDVRIKARLLNGVTLDVTDWTFRDVTEGRVAFSIDTISDGTTEGRVSTQSNVDVNCRNLPAKEKISVSWVCGTKSVAVASDKFTADISRVTIDKSAFASLTAEDDGKDITVILKGCYNKATKTAVVKYVPAPTITKIETDDLGGLNKGAGFNFKGTGMSWDSSRGDEVKATWTEGSTPKSQTFVPSTVTPTRMDFPTTSAWDDANAGTIVTFTVTMNGTTITKTTEVLGA